MRHPELDAAWHAGGNNIVCLSVPNIEGLADLIARAADEGIPGAEFYEPDLGNQLTSVALAEGAKRIVRALPLALAA